MYSGKSRQRMLTVMHVTFGGADQEQELGCVLISFNLLVC
jgi:hypothetical protein